MSKIVDLPRIKYGAYAINLDYKKIKGTHSVSLFIDRNPAIYCDSFGIEYIPQEVLNKSRDKSITHNMFRIQDNKSIMYGFCCIAFIEYMLAGKSLLDYINFFSLKDFKKNDKIIKKFLKINMSEETNLELRIRNIDETRGFLLDEKSIIRHESISTMLNTCFFSSSSYWLCFNF